MVQPPYAFPLFNQATPAPRPPALRLPSFVTDCHDPTVGQRVAAAYNTILTDRRALGVVEGDGGSAVALCLPTLGAERPDLQARILALQAAARAGGDVPPIGSKWSFLRFWDEDGPGCWEAVLCLRFDGKTAGDIDLGVVLGAKWCCECTDGRQILNTIARIGHVGVFFPSEGELAELLCIDASAPMLREGLAAVDALRDYEVITAAGEAARGLRS